MEKGTQACIDLLGCDKDLLNDIIFLKGLIEKAIMESDFILVEKIKMHQFNPQGVTGYALLSSSHIAIHTWPEYNFASIDIFACDSKEKVEIAADVIINGLNPKKVKSLIFSRGFLCQNANTNFMLQEPASNAA